MNKMAIALAADSAVTIQIVEENEDGESERKTKIYHSNKLFMLSKHQPVGIMVFNNAEMMGIPWESIIKSYRKELGTNAYDSLEEYGQRFIDYLGTNRLLFSEGLQEEYFTDVIEAFLGAIRESQDREVEAFIHKNKAITPVQIKSIINRVIKKICEDFEQHQLLPTIPPDFEKSLLLRYERIIDKIIADIFGNLPLSAVSRKRLKRFCASLFMRDYGERQYSGIVIAGFGTKDIFPALVSYTLEGVVNNILKYKIYKKRIIGQEVSAAIIPFAQDDMVHTFMQGINPAYQEALAGYLGTLFDKYPEEIAKGLPKLTAKEKKTFIAKIKNVGQVLVQDFSDDIVRYMQEKNINPIINTVEFLPLTELALMAESLVNLTSFKRRITMVEETVGGPIDVAIISKGDGFVWIRRKHYFEPDMNRHFFANYSR